MTAPLTRAEWLKQRSSFVGASEIASILGLPGAYATIGDVYVSKIIAQDESDDEAAAIDDPETAEKFDYKSIGLLVEPAIIEWYRRTNPNLKVRSNGLQIWRHPQYPFIGATLDADAENEFGDKHTVEAKNVSVFKRNEWGDEGSDQTPPSFAAQGVQQMLVRAHEGYDTFTAYPVFFGGNDAKTFTVPYNAKLAGQIVEVLSYFWNLVVTRTPPEIDYSRSGAAKLMRQIYNKIVGETLTLDAGSAANHRALELIYKRDYSDGEIKAWTARKEEAHAELLQIAGDYGRVEIPIVVDGKTKTLAINRKPKAGYPVSYVVEPSIATTFEPYLLKKRAEIFNALPEFKISDGAPQIEGETE
jgi:predicted phage-related endonuclease